MAPKRINSNLKGKVGERELCQVIREAGFQARRSQQYCGVAGDEDITHSLPGLYLECKRVERLNVPQAYAQAVRDSAASQGSPMPVVAHRANRSKWLVTLALDDLLRLMRDDTLD